MSNSPEWNAKQTTLTLSSVQHELTRARKQYPQWPDDVLHANTVVQAEAGELTQAVLDAVYQDGSVQQIRAEATQLAAMAIRLLDNLNQYQLPPTPQHTDD